MVYRVVLRIHKENQTCVDLKRYDVGSDGFIYGVDTEDEYIIIKEWILVYEMKPEVKS